MEGIGNRLEYFVDCSFFTIFARNEKQIPLGLDIPNKRIHDMDVEKISARLEKEDGLSRTLGMQFISTPEPDTLMAKMAVDDRNKQIFGFLSGGATLALAENVAGVGSNGICPGKMALGINVSGSHVKAMPYGGTVTAFGKLVHKGNKLHVWQVDVKNDNGEIISTVQVTNYVIDPKKK